MAGEIIFGLNAVEEAVLSNHPVNRIYFANESRAKGYKRVATAAKEKSIVIDYVPQAKLNDMTGTRDHQGVAAAVSPVSYSSLDDCLSGCGSQSVLVALDQIQHPKNLGMIIRTAVGAGADGVILVSRGGALIDESVVRASAGTVFKIPLVQANNIGQTLRTLKDAGYWVYGLDADGEQNVLDMNWPDRCVLVVGNESKGLRVGTRKVCDQLVSIPLKNEVESLNAAMAAGITLYQILADRGASD